MTHAGQQKSQPTGDSKDITVDIPRHELPPGLKLVFLASAARTGSSHVVELAHNSLVFDGIGELYNKNYCEGMNNDAVRFLERLGLPNNRSSKPLIEAIRSDPVKALGFASLVRQQNRPAALVKLMPACPATSHLPELIAVPNLHSVVFTSRPMIDALISQVKAARSKIWKQQDTTENRIKFDVNILAGHFRVVSKWYHDVRDLANAAGVPMGLLEYEADIKQAPQFTLDRFFAEARMGGQSISEPKSGFTIQDKNSHWREKVTNPQEIEAHIRRLGLEEAYFETFPKRSFITQPD